MKRSCLFFLGVGAGLWAQNESDERSLLRIYNGLSFQQDSVFLLNLRFRLQNRFGYYTQMDDTAAPGFEARVRRLRLRLDGFALSPRLSYYIQLSFAAGDQDFVPGFPPHIVRDAMVYYTFSPTFYVGFGQSKLPGNRQRVISSGNLQLPERSYANQFYNIDRDVGFFLYKTFHLGKVLLHGKAALTAGEGRLFGVYNPALAYTARIECLPFGPFQNSGDYSEGDLEQEPTPKLSVGVTYHYNPHTLRVGGQIGPVLRQPITLTTAIADLMGKYRGWGLLAEYFRREVQALSPTDTLSRTFPAGHAWNIQLSKLLARRHEIALRYTQIEPPTSLRSYQSFWRTYGIGYSYYLNGHRIKAQLYASIDERTPILRRAGFRYRLSLLGQVEFGI